MNQVRALSAQEVGLRFRPPLMANCERGVSQLLVAEHVKNCAAFLGFKAGDKDDFLACGTAFFFVRTSWSRALLYIVTAKHVLDLVPADKMPSGQLDRWWHQIYSAQTIGVEISS
jgi:hypothetical protein